MSILQKIEPRKRMMMGKKRAAPLAHSMEEFFEDFRPRRWAETFEPFGWQWPMGLDYERSFRLDVVDHEKELLVRGELPGIDKDDIKVTVMGDRLTIEAERAFEDDDKKDDYYRHEVGLGRLMRTITLPVEVDAENIQAHLQDGILEVMLPKQSVVERHTVKVA